MKLDKIITGDSAVVLQSFPSDCIDLTVTSPPYDNLRTYNGFTFDFETIARELFRVTRAGGVVVWVVGDQTKNGSETGTSFRQALYFMKCGFNLHDTMIYEWHRPPINSNRYEQHFEFMFVFSKGSPKSFNPIKKQSKHAGEKTSMKGIAQSNRDKNRIAKGNELGYRIINDEKILGNVWFIPAGKDLPDWERILVSKHPARFPEKLAQDHILSWSNEGDTVLDCFAGSGTTLKMAKILSRQYIGIEISPEYVTIAEKRLLATNVPLFGQERGLTLPAPDGGDSAPSQALSTPDMFSAIEHEPTPAPRR